MTPRPLIELEDSLIAYLHQADLDRPSISPDLVMESQIVREGIIQRCEDARMKTGLDFEIKMRPPDQKGGIWVVEAVLHRKQG